MDNLSLTKEARKSTGETAAYLCVLGIQAATGAALA